jgi:hypothetical protein
MQEGHQAKYSGRTFCFLSINLANWFWNVPS